MKHSSGSCWYIVAPLLIMLFINHNIKIQTVLLLVFVLISIALRFYFFNEYLHDKYSLSSLVWVANDQLYIHLYNFLIGYVESELVAGISSYQQQATLYRLSLGYVAILILAFVVFACLHIELGRMTYQAISFISLVSYSLYLYHLPVLNFLMNYNLPWY